MCVNFNCIFFRKSMQLDLNKNNKKLLLYQEYFQTEWKWRTRGMVYFLLTERVE